MKLFLRPLNNKKGFTLIEILVVIAIIAILAGVAIPNIFGYIQKTKEKADETNAGIIGRAYLSYIAYEATALTVTNEEAGVSGSTDISDYIDVVPTPKAAPSTADPDSFYVTVASDHSVTVFYGIAATGAPDGAVLYTSNPND